MGSRVRKQYISFAGIPILTHTIKKFVSFSIVDRIVLVIPGEDLKFCHDNILQPYGLADRVRMVESGPERSNSVKNGLMEVRKNAALFQKTLVMVHDGVRPFVDHLLMERCIKGAIEHNGACVPGLSVHDTLKKVDENYFVSGTIARDKVYQIQTPQVFDLKLILDAHDYAEKYNFSGTDDASLVENYGHEVFVTEGSKRNIKITVKDDLSLAEAFYFCSA